MNPLEEQLKNALRREDPRTGFAVRLRARIALQEERARRAGWSSILIPRLIWALGILICVGILAGILYRHQQSELAQGEAAKQQVFVALRLAGAKMQLAESKVRRLSE